MTAYIPALVWLISAVVCFWIAKHRRVKATPVKAVLVALIGPFAIPFMLVAKPEPFIQS